MAKRKAKKAPQKSWFERIAIARKQGEFTNKDVDDAGNWPDCACGEQSKFIPRDYDYPNNDGYGDGEPQDRKLSNLGASFAKAVMEDEFDKAESILVKIQNRSSEILNKLVVEYETKAKAIRNELRGTK